MKAIHAYVRHHLGERIIGALVNAGCRTMSVLEVRGISHDVAAGSLEFSVDLAQRVERVLKIEIICADDEAVGWAAVLARNALTGKRGDGILSILPVERTIELRTGLTTDSGPPGT